MQLRTTFLVVWSLVALLAAGAAPPLAAQTGTVRCESRSSGREQCPIERGAKVELTRHLSATPCRENSNWGVGQEFIWVSGGCRADFTVTRVAYFPPSQGNAPVTANQLRACRTEADRRLPGYSYDQIRVVGQSRQGDVARVRWMAGDAGGICTVAANGRIVGFTTRDDDDMDNGIGTGTGATTRVTCESKSTERQECRIPRGARVRLARQISQNPCRRNDTFGVGDGYLWVDKGCRAEFEVVEAGFERPGQPQVPPGGVGGTPATLICQSVGNTQRQCPIPQGATARLVRQITTVPCRLNVNYGSGNGFLWVNQGCGGEFEVSSGGMSGGNVGAGTGLPDRVTCESKGGERTECRIRSGARVQLARQLSSTPCNRNSTWGAGVGVIWVTGGCRGEFEVR
jgi:hypothetical protein